MKIIKSRVAIVLISVIILSISCARVNYVGRKYVPTNNIDMYYSKEEIKREYIVMGHALGSGTFTVSNDGIMKKMIEKAKISGADAILITGLGKSNVQAGNGSVDEKQIKASFLKYK